MRVVLGVLLAALVPAAVAAAPPLHEVDLATVSTGGGGLLRALGSTGDGSYGTPVAGGHDVDGDGLVDMTFASMRADALGRSGAGTVYVVFGDGTVSGALDTAVPSARVLRLHGAGPAEAAGSELWVDDVTGDGVGDVLIARQNHRPDAGRPGAGALTILVGGSALRTQAETLAPVDLAAMPPELTAFTIVGANAVDRLGMWIRTGDVDGDGVADLVVSADQTDGGGESDRGAVWVVRGGAHLAVDATVDLAAFGATTLAGNILEVTPPPGSTEFHFGATCQLADLDGNGRAEVLAAAALNRAGGVLLADGAPAGSAHPTGGVQDGTLWILWDDNVPAPPWPAGFTIALGAPPGTLTAINGGADNVSFGEEIVGGLDWDDDGSADLFVGDIVGDLTGRRIGSGSGHVFWGAAALKGLTFDLDLPPPGLLTTTFLGGAFTDIAADTAMQGDFDGDGVADLAFSSPHADALGRENAGAIHVVFGQSEPWPAVIDLATGALPDPSLVRIAEVYGANGTEVPDSGDTLCYSGAAGDVDGDGRDDLVTNEMLGNGVLPEAVDVGNLIVLSGALLTPPLDACDPVPRSGCRPAGRAMLRLFAGADPSHDRLRWAWTRGAATAPEDFGTPASGGEVYGLCLYDAAASPGPRLAVAAGTGPAWRPSGSIGWRYKPPPAGRPLVRRIALAAGDEGTPRITMKARGEGLGLPTLPLEMPLTAQFVVRTGAAIECWEATFTAARRNDARITIARSP